jgi:hypothetical protein
VPEEKAKIEQWIQPVFPFLSVYVIYPWLESQFVWSWRLNGVYRFISKLLLFCSSSESYLYKLTILLQYKSF